MLRRFPAAAISFAASSQTEMRDATFGFSLTESGLSMAVYP